MINPKETRKQRALDLRAFVARNKHLFSLKAVCAEASLNYESTVNAIGRLIRESEENAISDEKLDLLETAAIQLAERNVEKQSV